MNRIKMYFYIYLHIIMYLLDICEFYLEDYFIDNLIKVHYLMMRFVFYDAFVFFYVDIRWVQKFLDLIEDFFVVVV